jgi:LysM repeat protein
VREADVVVVCLSKQFNQAGFRQKEVRLALDTAMEKPEGEIFIIPARLEECDNLESLRKWHWVDLFEDDGYEMLMRALRARANKIGATLQIKKSWLPITSAQPDYSKKPSAPAKKNLIEIIQENQKEKRDGETFKILSKIFIAGLVVLVMAVMFSLPFLVSKTQSILTPTLTPFRPRTMTPTFVSSCPIPVGWGQIIVVPNDSLDVLATRYRISKDELRMANCLVTDSLVSGAVIYVPPVQTSSPGVCSQGAVGWIKSYIVQPGDSMYGIAQKYNVTPSLLKGVNCITSDLLYVNTILWVPNIVLQTSLPFTLTPFQPLTNTPSP